MLEVLSGWQDLIGATASTAVAIVAVCVSLAALRASHRQVETARAQIKLASDQDDARRRGRERAMRAALNDTLNGLSAWAEAMAEALGALPARRPISAAARSGFVAPATPKPELDALVRMIEATDESGVIDRLSRLISNVQVLTARTSRIATRRRPALLPEDVDVYLLDAVVVYAQVASLFRYARGARASAEAVGWTEADNAMSRLTLYGPRYDGLRALAARRQAAGREPETINEND